MQIELPSRALRHLYNLCVKVHMEENGMTKQKIEPARTESRSEELDLAITAADTANNAYLRPGMVYNKV